MFTLLAPLLLTAAGALAVPVLIHLWSRGEGPRVRVGSVRLLEVSSRAHARRLRLTRPGLLAVRLALLATLVVLLAEPVRRGAAPAPTPVRWALVASAVDAATPDAFVRLDSLRAAGFDLRALAPGFPPLDLDAPPPPADTAADAWSLLRDADAVLPPGSAVTVVAPPRLAYVHGVRPALAVPVTWLPAGEGAPARWIEAARAMPDGRVVATVGADDGTAIAVERVVWDPSEPAAALPLAVDGRSVRLPGGPARPLLPASDSLRVTLVADPAHAEDLHYVRTAVTAAAAHGRVPTALRIAYPDARLADADLVFWLADAPPPTDLPGLVVVAEASAVPEALPRPDGVTRRLAYAGRFHPAHDPVVLSADFPAWVLTLLHAAAPAIDAVPDHRRATTAQLTPARRHGDAPSKAGEDAPVTPLRFPVWTAALGLFALERWMARRP